MIEITPRFFILPLVAFAVIASLPRPTARVCPLQDMPVAGIVRMDAEPTPCPFPQQMVMGPNEAVVR